ncbi:MAG: tetratricopeptide repeat protein [Desulfuromonadaceae bacterium]|nr:tetratricopeptide repeat protein [Desulfuromonadaceae bacterium]MDD2849540.1 tetratricopeptide repeat protein [Desulfuromonadaceae bacterium]MDD4131966.1 tetratricopeptide repeat protein [Desulfuromonadaceae bacterium]
MGSKYFDLMINKAAKLREDGHPGDARHILDELAAITPDEPHLQYYLGMLCMGLHDNQAALGHFSRLVQLQPGFLEGRMLLGMMCAELGRHEEAIDLLRGVVAECPDVPEIHHRIGLCLADRHRYEEALSEYKEVLRLAPDHSGVLCSLGLLFTSTGQIGEARRMLLQAHEREPESVNVINNLGRVCKLGQAAASLDWYQMGLDLEPENASLTSNYLYTLNYIPGLTPEFIASKYKELAPRCYYPSHEWQRPDKAAGSAGRPLRIGYISGDFYGHSVSFFLEPILACHDRECIEIFCYSNRTDSDETMERLKGFCTGWRCIVGISDIQVAGMVANDGVDILVDLSGHTAAHRLGVLVYRPAPVQVSWIGHPNTTGLSQIDYYLTDPWCDPPGMTDHLYSERLYRLPRIFCCYLPPTKFPPVAAVPSVHSGSVTFGCFNSLTKINESLVSWWAQILDSLPGSRMFIKGPALDDAGTRDELFRSFAGNGIPAERLIVHGVTSTREEHLSRYSLVDIALDTFPYHGTTTTCESIWMGVPVVTLAGKTHVSRVGVSLLHTIGLEDLVAESPDEYIAKAVSLATDRQRLVWLRENLRTMMAQSPLMDVKGITRDVENAFHDMINVKAVR